MKIMKGGGGGGAGKEKREIMGKNWRGETRSSVSIGGRSKLPTRFGEARGGGNGQENVQINNIRARTH